MIRRLRRLIADWRLTLIDAEIARWYITDGQLSPAPLGSKLSATGLSLRTRRAKAVAALEAAGGRDPWPSVLDEPTEAQRAAHRTRRSAREGSGSDSPAIPEAQEGKRP